MNDIVVSYIIYFSIIIQIVGLAFAAFIDPYIIAKHRRVILINTLLTMILVAQNYFEVGFSKIANMYRVRLYVGIVGYIIRPLILLMWLYLVKKNQKLIVAWGLIVLNALIHLTALFSDICFTINKKNIFERGPLGYTCHIISGILLLYLLWLSSDMYIDLVYKKQRTEKEYNSSDNEEDSIGRWKDELFRYRNGMEGLLPIWCVLMIVVSVVLDSKLYSPDATVSFLTMAIVSSNLFYYIWLHTGLVQEHEEDLRARQRIQIMMSQIQPHFLYNTLSTIQALCLSDPERAAYTSEIFGVYLRQNLDSLNQTELIPIEKELEHTKIYVEIEQIRFPSINVEYDLNEIGDNDIYLPALSIQPIVENAIRHGVRGIKNGRIKVSVHKKDKLFEITIKDNGRGFNAGEVGGFGSTHIGIKNVKERIENQCKGTLSVESSPGEGTMVTICVPELDDME